MVKVRQKSRFGPCYPPGKLIRETATYPIHLSQRLGLFFSKSSSIHLAPCQVCADYQQSDEVA
jgi:hypothetical protein